MGFRKPMDYNSVHHQIYIAGVELHSKYNDGFNQFEIKKDSIYFLNKKNLNLVLQYLDYNLEMLIKDKSIDSIFHVKMAFVWVGLIALYFV